jgi:hypothetical protein
MKPKIKLSKPLSEILQPLVDLVPKFKVRSFDKFIWNNFPCGLWSAAAIVSLAKWKREHPIDRGANCALCQEDDSDECEKCPLLKIDYNACRLVSNYAKAMEGNKQLLINDLELASVYALIDDLRVKCEATVREVSK